MVKGFTRTGTLGWLGLKHTKQETLAVFAYLNDILVFCAEFTFLIKSKEFISGVTTEQESASQ